MGVDFFCLIKPTVLSEKYRAKFQLMKSPNSTLGINASASWAFDPSHLEQLQWSFLQISRKEVSFFSGEINLSLFWRPHSANVAHWWSLSHKNLVSWRRIKRNPLECVNNVKSTYLTWRIWMVILNCNVTTRHWRALRQLLARRVTHRVKLERICESALERRIRIPYY